ncbi:Glycosyltransferase involved in cell wall bisynthesis [Pseudomonas cuatrocienegasensis]|uniref:Glycosyltransferase involved in cell wall bisynthesis n=1 Tax=Pseudomonas cuatrocienegasensis TaxID=543360 RepID=A0ABY1B9R1_9PSED|nr:MULTISPECIES: glycosyltransferase [Pseudomonas]OEC35320.1 glycosyltransferase [Pseudomonas sp. 21C1]SEQ32054.1 Glycosyltransferase involved in cell wall bisynthesis [Pseudomonas cuatrocienegasensis]
MKILFLGDFSSLYQNLKEGLQELGHDPVIASYGDGWKKIPTDIYLGGGGSGWIEKIKRKTGPYVHYKKLTGFDVVQYINAFYFYHPLMPNKLLLDRLIKNNRKFYLSAAGSDAFYWRYGPEYLAYSPLDDYLKYDLKKKSTYLSSRSSLDFNSWLVSRVDGVVPIMYDYEISYKGVKSLKKVIPIPMNLKKIRYKENVVGNKLVVFHGLSRYGFKGTRHVEEAFSYLKHKYPNDLELIIAGGMPINQYLSLMERVNVVIDQVNSYSLGVNGIYALAMGKVVLGGAEPESLSSLNVVSSPVINLKPDSSSIIASIEYLLENRNLVSEISYSSRLFAETHHDYIKVAQKYLECWR